MALQARSVLLVASCFSLLPGCADDSDGDSASETSSGEETSGDGDGDSAGDQSINVGGSVGVYPSFQALAGAQVCWVQEDVASPCTSTDDVGAFSLEGVPANSQGAVRILGDEIVNFAYLLHTGEADLTIGPGFGIDTPQVHDAYFTQTGTSPVAGRVVVSAQLSPGANGYTFELDPSSGDGPFYYGSMAGELDPMATGTGNLGVGIVLNVDPAAGPFNASFAQGDSKCATGAVGETMEAWTIPAGVESVYLSLTCESN